MEAARLDARASLKRQRTTGWSESVTNDDRQRISAALTIDEVIERWPATAGVFVKRRMHCVGCDVARFETLAGACRIYGQPLDVVLAELHAAALAPRQGVSPGRE